jgi:hypothetical protein
MDEQVNHCHGQSDPDERAANAIREYALCAFVLGVSPARVTRFAPNGAALVSTIRRPFLRA